MRRTFTAAAASAADKASAEPYRLITLDQPQNDIKRPSQNPDTKDAIATETMEIKSAIPSADAYAAPSDEGQMQPMSRWQQWRHYWTSREGWIGDYVRSLSLLL
jgi:hypothetical protein